MVGTASSYGAELEVALALCDQADRMSTAVFERGPAITIKADGTPVTDADTAIETMLRARLAESFPDDAVIGEEFGHEGNAAREWIIDPIDGTKNFSGGIPLWSTLLGLRDAGRYVLGVVAIPGIGQRYWAAEGVGAFHDGAPISVSSIGTVSDSMVLYGDLEPMIGSSLERPFLALVAGARRSRGFGDAWGYGLVASGSAEVFIEPYLAIWDVAAPAAVVKIAGGRVTQMDGSRVAHGGSVVASNGLVHDAVLMALSDGVSA